MLSSRTVITARVSRMLGNISFFMRFLPLLHVFGFMLSGLVFVCQKVFVFLNRGFAWTSRIARIRVEASKCYSEDNGYFLIWNVDVSNS